MVVAVVAGKGRRGLVVMVGGRVAGGGMGLGVLFLDVERGRRMGRGAGGGFLRVVVSEGYGKKVDWG